MTLLLSALLAAPSPVVKAADAPTYLIAGGKGAARLFYNAQNGAADAAVTELRLSPGAAVPKHVHKTSTEILFLISGRVEMVVAGKTVRAGPGDAIYIPKNTEHSAKVLGRFEPVRAVQIYVGPGPEQRFAKGDEISGG